MNEQQHARDGNSSKFRRTVIAALMAIGLGAAGFAHAHGGWRGGWHGGLYDADPQTMQRRAEAMVKFWLADVDATEAQEKKIADIMATTMREVAPLRKQHRAARQEALAVLTKPQIDRAALEAIRQKELQLAEQVSQKITQSLADAAEVLTPEQRAKIAEKMAQRRRSGERHG